jgi:hypothetical protein
MNRLAIVLLLAGGLLVGLTGVAVANWGGSDTGAQPGHGDGHHGLRGVIVSVSTSSVVIKSHKSGEVTVAVDDSTKVKLGREKAGTLADLKAGERVLVFPATGTAKAIIILPKGEGHHHGGGCGSNTSATPASTAQ